MALNSFLDQYRLPAMGNHAKRKGLAERNSLGIVQANQDNVLEQIYNQKQLNPQIFSMLSEAARMMTPAGMNSDANAFAIGRQNQAQDAGMDMMSRMMQAGVSASGSAGALRDQQNQAVRDANAYRYQKLDPAKLLQLAQMLSQASMPNAVGTSMAGVQGVFNRPGGEEKQGGGLFDSIAGIVGMGTGMGMDWGQVFSGGGGGWKGIPYK